MKFVWILFRSSFAVLIVISVPQGCSQQSTSSKPLGKSWAIKDVAGEYRLLGSDLTLVVKDAGSLLDFHVSNPLKKVVLRSELKPSTFSHWVLAWNETTQTLWLGSSDIGTFAWFQDGDGVFERKTLLEMTQEEAETAPLAFRNELPASTRDVFISILSE